MDGDEEQGLVTSAAATVLTVLVWCVVVAVAYLLSLAFWPAAN